MQTHILIPAYNPSDKLIDFAKKLSSYEQIYKVVIVNDGSNVEYNSIFDQIGKLDKITVLKHKKNKGKGAALKTGIEYINSNCKDCTGIITADADEQHSIEDILKMAGALSNNKNSLILGVRKFNKNIPLKSKIGNTLTRWITSTFFRLKISDTQTGLRGIPTIFIPNLLKIQFNGYEFEMEMLLMANRLGIEVKEVPIKTIYIDNNASSHFNPLIDSIKIYFVLLRHGFTSIITAVVDFIIFISLFSTLNNILLTTYVARFIALFVQYIIVKKFVFYYSSEKTTKTFPKYILLVIFSGFISSTIIFYETQALGLSILMSKLIAEFFLYLFNFTIQYKFIFNIKKEKQVL